MPKKKEAVKLPKVEKRGNSYRIRISTGYDVDGKQVVRTISHKKELYETEDEVISMLIEKAKEIKGDYENSIKITPASKFEDVAREWFRQEEERKTLKELTLTRYHSLEERTYKAIGHMKLSNISKKTVQNFINSLGRAGVNELTGGPLSTKTQSLHVGFISDVFKFAIDNEANVENPCHEIKLTNVQKKEIVCYSPEEVKEFMKLLNSKAPMKYKTFFTLVLFAGFRKGELLGLEWKDIDFDRKTIFVQRESVYQHGVGTITCTTKTIKSKRIIPMSDEIINLLREYKKEQDKQKELIGDKWNETDRLFTTFDGKPMGPDTCRHWLEKFCKNNGLKYVNVHSFRHYVATHLIYAGVDAASISNLLGHARITTTLDIYANAFTRSNNKASEIMSDLLFN